MLVVVEVELEYHTRCHKKDPSDSNARDLCKGPQTHPSAHSRRMSDGGGDDDDDCRMWSWMKDEKTSYLAVGFVVGPIPYFVHS